MRQHMRQKYERLVIRYDHLKQHIEEMEQLIELMLVEVYLGKLGFKEAQIQVSVATEIQTDLIHQLNDVRLRKSVLAYLIDNAGLFH